MKKTIVALLMAVVSLAANAQDFKFAYFSFDTALKSMPDYGLALANIDKLRTQYDAELKRAEKEFNTKYEDFLENQRAMDPVILDKRQAELQEIQDKIDTGPGRLRINERSAEPQVQESLRRR